MLGGPPPLPLTGNNTLPVLFPPRNLPQQSVASPRQPSQTSSSPVAWLPGISPGLGVDNFMTISYWLLTIYHSLVHHLVSHHHHRLYLNAKC